MSRTNPDPHPENFFTDGITEGIKMKVYVYCRVSTDKQDINKQFEEIQGYCLENKLLPLRKNVYYDNGVSGGICWKERQTNVLNEVLKKGCILIVPEITRLGRDCFEVMELISILLRKGIEIHDIKNNLILTEEKKIDDVLKVVFVSIFGEMERSMIKTRTKTAMNTEAVKKKMQRPNKLDKHLELIKQRIEEKKNPNQIALELDVNKAQVYKFCRDKNLL